MQSDSPLTRTDALRIVVSAESDIHVPLDQDQVKFLVNYMQHGVLSTTARKSSVHMQSHREWLETSSAYREAFEKCHNAFIDKLREAAYSRAVDGWQEPVFFRGEQCGEITKFDNTLLMRLLESHDDTFVKKAHTKQEVEATHKLVVVLEGDSDEGPSLGVEGSQPRSVQNKASIRATGGASGDGENIGDSGQGSDDSGDIPSLPDRPDSADESLDDADGIEDVGGRDIPSGTSGEHEDKSSE